jgi:hypothetical protein
LVWSNDGGATWSSPAVVTETCETAPGKGPVVEFSEVAVDRPVRPSTSPGKTF